MEHGRRECIKIECNRRGGDAKKLNNRTRVLMSAEGASGEVVFIDAVAMRPRDKAFPNLPSSVNPGVVTGKACLIMQKAKASQVLASIS